MNIVTNLAQLERKVNGSTRNLVHIWYAMPQILSDGSDIGFQPRETFWTFHRTRDN